MKELLTPIELEEEFEYQVDKDGVSYIAGTKKCHFVSGRSIFGDLLLDRVDYKEVRVRAPRITNPFATETRHRQTREGELYLRNIMISHSSWSSNSFDEFIEGVEVKIVQEYQARMDTEDLRLFFQEVFEHYKDYL